MIGVDPYLYILMRTDLESMNPGKGMAQACHAANACVNRLTHISSDHDLNAMLKKWERSTGQYFGTTVVLDGGTARQISETIMMINDKKDPHVIADVIHDPTYPLIDGKTLHILPLDTCAYVFCDKNNENIRFILDQFPLHP